PLVFALPVGGFSNSKKTMAHAIYHGFRIIGYATIGIILGQFGKSLALLGYQKGLSVFAGILLILIALFNLKSLNPILFRYKTFLSKLIGKYHRKKTYSSFSFLGFLNAFLPCGLS